MSEVNPRVHEVVGDLLERHDLAKAPMPPPRGVRRPRCGAGVQLHGGIAMTWEHPMHLYLERATSDQLALGTPSRHREDLSVLVDLVR